MKNKIYNIIFAGLVLSLIHCGGGSNNSSGLPPFDLPGGGPNIDEAPIPDIEEGEGVTHEAADIKLVTPADDSIDVAANTSVSVEFTAPATEVEINVQHMHNFNDVFSPLQGTSGYNAQTFTALFAPDNGLQTDQHYIVTVSWKALPDDVEKQEFTWNFATVKTIDAPPAAGSFGPLMTLTPDFTKIDFTVNFQEENSQTATNVVGVKIPELINKDLLNAKMDSLKVLGNTGCPNPRAYCLSEEVVPGQPDETLPINPAVDPVRGAIY